LRVLFDVNVPKRLRRLLQGHTISTAQEQGWGALDNGELLAAAEDANFEILVTCDQNIAHQQSLKKRAIALVVLSTNDWSILQNAGTTIAAAIDLARPRGFQRVDVDPATRRN
jgi:predicted nuclease of predicted toxin-antitoxin system